MKARMMSYTEAIGLALVIAAVLGGWARSAFERPGDPDIACVPRLESSGGEVALRNLHCSHVVGLRARRRPTSVRRNSPLREISARGLLTLVNTQLGPQKTSSASSTPS